MASAFGHAVAALAIGTAFTPAEPLDPPAPAAAGGSLARVEIPRWWMLGVVAAVLPDADLFGFAMGVNYGDFLGHRGFTHSLVFAALVATAFTLAFPRRRWRVSPLSAWCYFFLATASHDVLDMLTNGGLGVAIFSPFDLTRYFLPWQPIQVSPIGVGSFFSAEGLAVIRSEFVWIGIPSFVFAAVALVVRRRLAPARVAATNGKVA